MHPDYAWYGDDFTGATDTLATLAQRGVAAFLFLGVPSDAHLRQVGPLQAIGIAGSARSMAPGAMRRELAPVRDFFAEIAAPLVHYKCCSTFDSAPHIGNLVTAIEALRPADESRPAFVLGGQPSLGRYCAFGNLFAKAGADIYRIDRHPTMSRHPSTPMGEADLRLHLKNLGAPAVRLLSWHELEQAKPFGDTDADYILIDTLTDTHIVQIGNLLRAEIAKFGQVTILGASSVAQAMFPHQEPPEPLHLPADGPVLAVAGSLSPLTRTQLAAATRYEKLAVDAARLVAESAYREETTKALVNGLRAGLHMLATTAPADGAALAADAQLAAATGRLTDAVLRQAPVSRLLVAGGDTSSHVVQHLDVWGLSSLGIFAPGVAVSRARSDDPDRDGLILLLKGGQMGDDRLFDRFAA